MNEGFLFVCFSLFVFSGCDINLARTGKRVVMVTMCGSCEHVGFCFHVSPGQLYFFKNT